MKRVLEVELTHDEVANAAAITFDPIARGRALRTLEVTDGASTTLATVTFDAHGALVQIELLDAARQLPAALRADGG